MEKKAKLSPLLNPDKDKIPDENQKILPNQPNVKEARIKLEENDRLQILSIFPEELWLMIFDNIDDPKDFENLNQASPYFCRLLTEKRVLFLFPQVLQVLKTHHEKEQEKDNEKMKTDFLNNVHNLWHFINTLDDSPLEQWHSVLKRFRLVSRTYCQTVDKSFQNISHHYKSTNLSKNDLKEAWPTVEVEPGFDNGIDRNKIFKTNNSFREIRNGELDKFLKHFENSHLENGKRCPFIGRSVSFKYLDKKVMLREELQRLVNLRLEEDIEVVIVSTDAGKTRIFNGFINNMTTVLRKYGRHLWYCTIAIQDRFATRLEYYKKLKEWLEFMPELKILDLKYMKLNRLENFREEVVNLSQDEIAELEQERMENPLPTLENLKLIKAMNVPAPILNELIRKNENAPCFGNLPYQKDEDD